MDHVQKREQTAGETDNGNDDTSYAVLRRNVVIALSTHREHCIIVNLVSISHDVPNHSTDAIALTLLLVLGAGISTHCRDRRISSLRADRTYALCRVVPRLEGLLMRRTLRRGCHILL